MARCFEAHEWGYLCQLPAGHADMHREDHPNGKGGSFRWYTRRGNGKVARRCRRMTAKARRRAYLASKPRCFCGRVGVESVYIVDAGTWEERIEWFCRGHREEAEQIEDDDDCMCEWPRTCGGLGSIECRGCGGDLCVCICRGGPIECDGCEDCNHGRGEYDFYFDDDEAIDPNCEED